MLKTIRLLFFAVAVLAGFLVAGAAETVFKTPDFAFPKTVEKDALALLKKADSMPARSAAQVRLRAVLELAAARTRIAPDSVYSIPQFIASQRNKRNRTDASDAMLTALEAHVLARIYTGNKAVYDRVSAPPEPYPADVSEWSGEQFRTRISQLYNEAVALKTDQTPLESFADCLEYNDVALLYINTVGGFIRNLYLQDYIACNLGTAVCRDGAARICDGALATVKEGSYPFFYWSVQKLSGCYGSPDFDALAALYDRYSRDEAARYVLTVMDVSRSGPSVTPDTEPASARRDERYAAMLRESLASFPSWYGNGCLTNRLNILTAPGVAVAVPALVPSDTVFRVRYGYEYGQNIRFSVHRVTSDNGNLTAEAIRKRMPEVWSRTVTVSGGRDTASVYVDGLAAGEYALVASVDGQTPDAFSRFSSVPVFAFAMSSGCDVIAAAVDFRNGKPMEGASFYARSRAQAPGAETFMGQTAKNGTVSYTFDAASDPSGRVLSVETDGARYSFNNYLNVYPYEYKPSESAAQVSVLTDRFLYHPGDSVAWLAIAYKDKSVMAGESVEVFLSDANGTRVDSATVNTDAHGRATGRFVTRKGTLTGNYTLRVRVGGKTVGYGTVMVSDFKMPTFETVVDSISRDFPAPGAVTVSGSAHTYSGMPVADASVDVTLSAATRGRWLFASQRLGSVQTRTDASGSYTVVLPDSLFAAAPDGTMGYMVEATVTDGAGEATSASRGFVTGKPYTLEVQTPSFVDTSKPFELDVKAYDASGKPVSIAYRWHLDNIGHTPGQPHGSGMTGIAQTLDFSNVLSAEWSIVVEPADTLLADAVRSPEMTFYNMAANTMPASAPAIFLPETAVRVKNGLIQFPLGINADDFYCYVVYNGSDRKPEVQLYHMLKGLSTFSIAPSDAEGATLTLCGVCNGAFEARTVTVLPPVDEQPEMEVETFRDRLTPGATETWRFRLAKGSVTYPRAAAVATMYNAALDAMCPRSAPARLGTSAYLSTPFLRMCCPRTGSTEFSIIGKYDFKAVTEPLWPVFDFMSEVSMPAINGGTIMYRSMHIRGTGNAMEKMVDMAAPVYASAATAGGVVEETAEADSAVEEEETADAGAGRQFKYRDASVMQAFWQPLLETDGDGYVDVVFTVPEANCTWKFYTLAWTDHMQSASVTREAVASKSVMVQPALPRFLRQGDTATLLATVYNNTGAEASVSSTVELFDLESGAVIKTAQYTSLLDSGASAVVGIDLTATADASAIGYRVRATSGTFTDGEQTVIPVLASEATVVESTQFYLNADENTPFTLELTPKPGAELTLQYCQNPVWTVVKAMRGLSDNADGSATALASGLFSSLAGMHIAQSNPDVEKVIRQWSAGGDSRELTSMLARNEELKLLLLDSTPWLQTAASQSQRMASLCEFLDPDKCAASVAASRKALAGLSCHDGGFAWGKWSVEPSPWVTRRVLVTLGIARSLFAGVSDFDSMLQPAFAYLQREAAMSKNSSPDYELALIAALYPDYSLTPEGQGIVAKAVDGIEKNWKHFSVAEKACAVLVMKAQRRDGTAAEIVASLRQYAVEQPGMGLCFPSVTDIRTYATVIQAFAAMGASKHELDAMRQWITVQAQASDNLGADNPDYVIAAVMLTGSDWTSAPDDSCVTVNGQPLSADELDRATGYISCRLPADAAPLKVSVRPNGVTPSYGSVTSVSSSEASSVEARPGKDISVEKHYQALRDGRWVETDTFALGEAVVVRLTVKAARDLEYVTVVDGSAACLSPVIQTPHYYGSNGVQFYVECRDSENRLFATRLPKGTYQISYDMTASVSGTFSGGIATVQSQYAPELSAHSGGAVVRVEQGASAPKQ